LSSKQTIEWDVFLQIKLERMTEEELLNFFDKHNVKLEGKLWGKPTVEVQ
jgi:hypothetical protein